MKSQQVVSKLLWPANENPEREKEKKGKSGDINETRDRHLINRRQMSGRGAARGWGVRRKAGSSSSSSSPYFYGTNAPQVKCALWQAKQALLAFFRLGLEGSLGSYFFLSWEEPLAPAGSAMLSSSSLRKVSESSSFSDTGSETSAPLSSMSSGIMATVFIYNGKALLGACTAETDYLSRRSCRPIALANQGSDPNPSKPLR